MRNDYIMRIIEQFVQALIAIIKRRKAGEYKEVVQDIKKAGRYYLKIDVDILLFSSPDQILENFKDSNDELDTEKCVLAADLLYELALVKEAQQQMEEALRLKQICLHLYETALPKEPYFQTPERFEKIALLKK